MRSFLAVAAMCGTMFTPVLTTAASAASTQLSENPTAKRASDAKAQMDAVCKGIADAVDRGTTGLDRITYEVAMGDVSLVDGPAKTGSELNKRKIVFSGTYVPTAKAIVGDPMRIGGSVNMFGEQVSTDGYWTNHSYEFDAEATSKFSYAFECNVSREVYVPAVPATPGDGRYVIYSDGQGADDNGSGSGPGGGQGGQGGGNLPGGPDRTNCEAQNNNQNKPWWGQQYIPSDTIRHCVFEGSVGDPGKDAYYEPKEKVETSTPAPIELTQSDLLAYSEDQGGQIDDSTDYALGRVVICISPAKVTATSTWRAQNGYGGGALDGTAGLPGCSTSWFMKAQRDPTSSITSNGTYISVPGYPG